MKRLGPTGTSTGARKGVATIRRFRYVADGTCYVVLERENGQRAKLTVEPTVARRLLDEYGHLERAANFISVEPLIGMKVSFEESGVGMLTSLVPFRN